MKICPHCGGEIQDAAIKCKHCRENIAEAPATFFQEQSVNVKLSSHPPIADSTAIIGKEPTPSQSQKNGLKIALITVAVVGTISLAIGFVHVGTGNKLSNRTKSVEKTSVSLPPEAQIASSPPEDKLGDWLKKAEAGDAYCQAVVGIKCRVGDGVPIDFRKALEFSLKSSKQGNPLGTFNLGWLYEAGDGVQKDAERASKCYSLALSRITNLAESGDAWAQIALGRCLAVGSGINKNPSEAVQWFRKAAEQGNAEGQCWLGMCIATGLGIERNPEEAMQWYQKAAEQGNVGGQIEYGDALALGVGGVEINEKEATQWYRKAAENGDPIAQFKLGDCLFYGRGIDKSEKEAVYWYQKSAEQDYDLGVDSLIKCLDNGIRGEMSEKEIVRWYRKAAEQGNAEAQYRLGEFLQSTEGTKQNEQEAAKWYAKAAAQGNKAAAKKVEELAAATIRNNLRTSLQGGPEPEILAYFLENKFIANSRKKSAHEQLSELKLRNEYKRQIDGETFYFFEFTGYNWWFSDSAPPEIQYCFSLVKRGNSWYAYKNLQ